MDFGGINFRYSNQYVVFSSIPKNKLVFTILGGSPNSGAVLESVDSSNNKEIVMKYKLEQGPNECFGYAIYPFWRKIVRVSPKKGSLIDVSEKFPNYYKSLAENYKKDLERVETVDSQAASNRCKETLRTLIGMAENISRGSSARTSAPLSTPQAPSPPPPPRDVLK
jgi:hypothetical protein